MKTVAFHTLGCKLNFSETSTIARQFRAAGWKRVDFPNPADVVIVNTCSVTENADRECRSIVNRAMKSNPDSCVVVIGCYAQLKPEEIAGIPGVSLVLGATEKFNVLNYLERAGRQEKAAVMACEIEEASSFVSAWSSSDRTRTFLKVQDGCDYSCTFCTIPLARGRSRSDTVQNVVNNIREIVSLGAKEIVLTGVNLGDFGIRDGSGRHQDRFTDLALEIEKVEGLERVRVSSIEPNLVTEEFIKLVASSDKFMPHFHMPLQSGSDEILAMMKRRYRTSLYVSKVEKIKELMPHAAIGVDVITGFPGETDKHFRETYDFLHRLPVSYLHVFTYSERDNTPAALMDSPVPLNIRKERNRMLRNLSMKKQHAFYSAHIGDSMPVLFEEENNEGLMMGYTPNYIRVVHEWKPEWVNQIVNCRLERIGPDGFPEVYPVIPEPVNAC